MLRRAPFIDVDPRPIVCLSANTTWYVANFRSRLIESLIDQGWRVVVLSPPDRHVERLAALGAEHVPLTLDNAGTNPLRELGTLWRIRAALSQIGPSVVLTFTPKINIYLSLVARTLGVPVIANISGLGRAFVSGGWIEKVSRALYGVALRWPSTVFFQNEEDRATFIEAGLVDAARTHRLPEVEFALAGFLDVDNPSAVPRSAVEEWEREGVIKFLGSFDDMVPVYAQADCVVLPSYYREGVPRSLLEAASMGKPVITTDSVGCRDTVEDGVTGWLVRPRDIGDLARKIIAVIDAPAGYLAALQVNARLFIQQSFDERIVISAYLSAMPSRGKSSRSEFISNIRSST